MKNITKNELKKVSDTMQYKDIRNTAGNKSTKEKEAYNEGVMDLADKICSVLDLKD